MLHSNIELLFTLKAIIVCDQEPLAKRPQDPEPIEPCPQFLSTKNEKYQQDGLVEMESWPKGHEIVRSS
jgi:hypothetical protein